MRSFDSLSVGQTVKIAVKVGCGHYSRQAYTVEATGDIIEFTRWDRRPVGKLKPHFAIVALPDGREFQVTCGEISA